MDYLRQDAVQREAEDLIAYMLERDAEIRERLRRITALAEQQRKAVRKNGKPEATLAGADFEARERK